MVAIRVKIVLIFLLLFTVPFAGGETVFPLKIHESNRYLVDGTGKPYLYNADTAWMLFLQLTPEEAEEYMDLRLAQGFNTLQLILTGFLGNKTIDGLLPFDEANDFSKPNEAYFAHVERVIEKAAERNLLLSIAPLWSGCCNEGWAKVNREGDLKPININGVEKCRAFGNYLGQRFGKFNNIMWIMGGDNDPQESKDVIRAVAEGIQEKAPHQFCTFHPSSSHSSTDVWENESWLNVVMVYTYFRGFNKAWNKDQPDVYEISYKEYNKTPIKPFFLGESTYEGEHDDWGNARQARKQAYWCILSGGMGHAYGSPNWRVPSSWREILRSPGAESLKYYRQLFESLPWYTLVPDEKNEIAIAGRGEYAQNNYATTAIAKDGSFLMTYFPTPRTITYDLSKLSGGSLQARWYDPTDGSYRDAEEGFIKNEGTHRFTPPEKNAAGDLDWVLLCEVKE